MKVSAPIHKPQGAIAGIGEALGADARTGQYMARLLREARAGLWPETGSGRRSLIGIPDMVNLTIAIACAPGRPIDGPRVVREFRALAAMKGTATRRNADGRLCDADISWLPTPNLADWIDAWVNSLVGVESGAAEAPHRLADAEAQQPTIRLISTTPLSAEVILPAADDSGSFDRVLFEVPGQDITVPSRLHRTEIVIGLNEMRALAAIARAAFQGPSDTSTDSASTPGRDEESATPETTKAAGPGSHDGLLVEQPAPTAQDAPLDKAHSAISKGSKQRLPKRMGCRSQERHLPAPERTRHNGTHWSPPTST